MGYKQRCYQKWQVKRSSDFKILKEDDLQPKILYYQLNMKHFL